MSVEAGEGEAKGGRPRRGRRRGWGPWVRAGLPVLGAAFAAVMCAGPLAVPATMAWFEGLACPGTQHLEVLEVMDISVTPAETRQVVYCVDEAGQGTLAGARPFVVMWVSYFAIFVVAGLGMVAVGGWFGRWFFGMPKHRLAWEAEREARALLAQGKRDEAIRLVQEKTGAGPRWARQYVEVMGEKDRGGETRA